MFDTRMVTKEMLNKPVDLIIKGKLDFDSAKRIADKKAREAVENPMLLAWYEKKSGKHSPTIVYGCQEKPSWLVYAQFRGAALEVNINSEDYVFVYKDRGAYP